MHLNTTAAAIAENNCKALWAVVDTLVNCSEPTGVSRQGLVDLTSYAIDDSRFVCWTASAHPSVHHYGQGGLIQHTREVVETCIRMCEYYGGVDKKLMFLAALYHDFGKIWDYAPNETVEGTWTSTDDKHKIYHITRSVLEFTKATELLTNADRLTQDQIDQVIHAILSHHGRPEWKSPVVPQTKMAWILHLCDSMSARVADCDLPKDQYSK